MIIDSHCHLHDEKFQNDLEEVLNRAKNVGISHFISIGCDILTTNNAKKLSNKHKEIYFSAGFHPHEAKFLNDDNLYQLKELAKHEKCVAIGECGLDYYYKHSSHDEQKSALIKQIGLANELNKPLVIHLRDAFDDFIAIMDSRQNINQKVLLHCFTGTLAEALEFNNRQFFISLSGIITFKKPGELLQVAKNIPLDRLLVETDSPYLSPEPHRGKRNEPSFIVNVLKMIAEAKNESLEKVQKQIFMNTLEFFQIEA